MLEKGLKRIKLTKGYAIVDDDDYETIRQYRWHLSNGYACRTYVLNGKKAYCYMHRQINNTPIGLYTDHINGNKLDNRRNNLRVVTKSQNSANSSKRSDNLSSNYRGVRRNTASSTFMARIRKDGIVYYIGSFKTQLEAATAYNEKALQLFGEYAKLNVLE